MKKLTVLLSMAAVVAALAAGVSGVFDTGSQTVHASRLAGISQAGSTGIQVQNLDATQPANVLAEFYKHGATGSPVGIPRNGVPAGSATNIYLPLETTLQPGAYAAIISADRQIAAIARTDWASSGGAAIYSNVIPSTEVALPLAVIDYVKQSSIVSIQNTDTTQTASVAVELYATGNASAVLTQNYSINPGTAMTIDLGNNPAFLGVQDNTAQGFLGSMLVKSAVPVGVQSFVDITSSDMAVYAFEGVPSENASDTLYAPLIRRQQQPSPGTFYDTGISVVNPNASPVDVTVTYYGGLLACAGNTYTHGPINIAAGSSHVFYQGPDSTLADKNGLPDNCVGSAVITSTGGNVLAIVNDSLNFTVQSAAYNAASADQSATKVALPLARNRHVPGYDFTTGIQIMNVGTSVANVDVMFADNNGTPLNTCGADCTSTIQPNASFTIIPGVGNNAMPADSYGSAVVNSSNGQPLVVIVNDFSFAGRTDAATYNGIKADL